MAYPDADDMLRQFEARIDEQLAQADRLRSAMESLQVTKRVRDGSVAVTVDSSGGLAGLKLSAAALRLGPDELANEILACAKGAQAALADQMGRTVSGVLGAGSETADYVARAYADKFRPADEPEDADRYRDPYMEKQAGRGDDDG
jgi:YbaB/EbfC DNA-binding family